MTAISDDGKARGGTSPNDNHAKALNELNIYDPETPSHVHETLDYARRHCPVSWSEAHGGYWVVSRFEDVKAVLRDDTTFSSSKGKSIPPRQPLMMPPLDVDPPEHIHYRRMLNPYFSRTALQHHEETMREACRTNIANWIDRGRFDVVHEFASAYVASVVARVIFELDDPDEISMVQDWVEGIHRVDDNTEASYHALIDYIKSLLGSRKGRSKSSNDIVAAIANGQIAGRDLSDTEKIGIMMLLVLGSLDSTRSSISDIIYEMVCHDGLEARVREVDLMRGDLDELLRFESPVSCVARFVTQDTLLGDQQLRAGEWVLVHIASANRDPERFENADTLDFGRRVNQHIAFGLGIHRCLGSNLAQMLIQVGFDELLQQVCHIRRVDHRPLRFAPGVVWHPVDFVVKFDRMA